MIQQLFGPNGFIHYQEDENGYVTIFWAGKAYYFFNREDTFAKNVGIAIMASIGVLQKKLCEIFRVSRRTVVRIKIIYDTQGVEALKDYRKGPVGIEKDLKDFIIKKYTELEGVRGYQNKILSLVQEKYEKGEFKSTISRGRMHVIIKEYKEDRERTKLENEEEIKQREEKRKEREDKQND